MCYNLALVHDKLLGVPAIVKLVYSYMMNWFFTRLKHDFTRLGWVDAWMGS